ncbi:MAG: hypothetical protein AAB883_01075, partial [Patescibacteria group bacterium]
GETGQRANFLPWNEIFTGGPACVKGSIGKSLFDDLNLGQLPGVTGATSTDGGGITVPPPTGVGACNAATLQSLATKSGTSLTSAEAKTFACLAQYESSCGARNLNYNWNKGSSAAGAFQVLLDGNSACYDNAVCAKAAGVSGTTLNCSAGFSGGRISNKDIAQRCVNAASNLACSLAAAKCVKNQQGFSAWTADSNSRGQKACISTYNR